MNNKYFSLIAGLLILSSGLFGQIMEFETTKSSIEQQVSLKEKFYNYATFDFKGQQFNENYEEEYSRANSNGFVDINLKVGEEIFELELQEFNLLSSDYFVSVLDENQVNISKERPTVKTYRGYHKPSGKEVRLTVDKGFIYGFIETGKTTFYIEPVFYYESDIRQDLFFLYDIKDAAPLPDRRCAADFRHNLQGLSEENNLEDRSVNCKEIDYSIASDYSMFTKYGGQIGLQNRNIAVVNSFQPNWINVFTNDYIFLIATQFISSCSTCDPWTNSTDSEALLNSFSSWGAAGNFGVVTDVATLWSNRNFNGSTIGLAWLNAVCKNSIKYNVCEDFSSNAEFIRVLVAHELGHNFGAGHDASGSNTIMAPSVNTATTWSTNSRNQINGYMNSGSVTCDTDCPPDDEPVADFGSDVREGCAPLVVNFFDNSDGNPTQWFWSFPGGIPSTSTQQNPSVTYPDPGYYEVTLVATNNLGSSTVTKSNYITVIGFEPLDIILVQDGGTVSFINNADPSNLYFWDFGDGTTSNDYSPVHTYDASGEVTITVQGIGECGTQTLTFTTIIILPITADFFGDITEGCSPLEVQFINLSSDEATNFQWHFEGGNPSNSSLYNPLVLYNTPGVYTVTLTAINIYTFDIKEEIGYIIVNAAPIADFEILQNEAFISTINNSQFGDTYFWNFGDGTTSLDFEPVKTYTESGVYTVTLQVTNSCGTDTHTFEVTVNLGVTAAFNFDMAGECAPLTVQYSDQSIGEVDTYLWSFPGGTPNTSTIANPVVVYTSPGIYSASLTVSNSNNDSDQIILTDIIEVKGFPVADIDFEQNEETVILTNNSLNFTSVAYSMGDGTVYNDMNQVVHIYSGPGDYTITVTLSNECGISEQTFIVNIAEDINAFFDFDITGECAPVLVQYNNLSTGENLTYAWSFPGGTPSGSTLENPVISYNQQGTFSATLTVNDGSETSTYTINNAISVNVLPVIDIAYSKIGNTVTLVNNSSFFSMVTYDFGDGTLIINQPSATHTYEEEGSYTIIVTVSNACGEAEEIFNNILVQFPSVADFEVQAASGCVPFTANFQNLSSDNTVSFIWNFEGGSPSVSTLENPVVVYNTSGIFDVQLISIAPGGNDTLLMEDYITVGILPDAFFTFNRSGLTVNFFNQTDFGNSYIWSFGDGNISTEENPVHIYTEEGIYSVRLIVTNECGSDTIIRNVNLFNIPNSGFQVSSQSGCIPFEVQFENLTEGEADSYLWFFPGGVPATSTEENPVVNYFSEGIYDVTLISTNAVGADTLIFPNFISAFLTPQFDVTVNLVGFTATLSTTELIEYTYSWIFEGGIEKNGSTVIHTFSNPGTYIVDLVITGPCGTFAESVEVILNENAPVTNFSTSGGGTAGCTPFEVSFTDMSTNEPTSWLWEFEGGEPSVSVLQNPVVTYNIPGQYSVSLTATNNAGAQTRLKVAYINAYGDPVAEFDAQIEDNSVLFENLSFGGGNYFWDFGDGNTSEQKDPVHTYSSTGEYVASLIVSNSCGVDTFTMNIVIFTVSTFDLNSGSDLKIYPNPTKGIITIDYKNLSSGIESFELLSMLGNTIEKVDADQFGSSATGRITKLFSYSGLGNAILKVNFKDGKVYFQKLVFIN